jgi:integrase
VFSALVKSLQGAPAGTPSRTNLRLKAGPAWHQTDYVFTMDSGAPIDPDNLSHEFRHIVNEAELPRGTFHGLRHSFATALLPANVHPAVVQDPIKHWMDDPPLRGRRSLRSSGAAV